MTAISTDEIPRKILKRDRPIAVVGLSDKSYRPSYEVAAYLRQNGYRIVPVDPLLARARRMLRRSFAASQLRSGAHAPLGRRYAI
ncbi:CoA-binding protein [Burkholderia thailandensis]|uniref:CoA-binding protein n=1 Tax=Burkholderia thailandensis TaxID=57975 RepID=UPI0022AC3F6C|nr:CoA-binding protein [Burkholderia thailandensis]MCZ2895426.1 CoA-binding protein [Burkholderia thailandensis]